MKTDKRLFLLPSAVVLVAASLWQSTSAAPKRTMGIPFYAHTVGSASVLQTSAFPGDVDGDGDLDILGTGFFWDPYLPAGEIAWWENDGGEGFLKHSIDEEFPNASFVYAVDMDEDLDIDILGASCDEAGTITWWENDGNEDFTGHIIDSQFIGARSVSAVDVDDDGDVDVLGAGSAPAPPHEGGIAWWENDGDQSFVRHTIDNGVDGAQSAYAADVDADGDVDVLGVGGIPTSPTCGEIAWWENDGAEAFIKHSIDNDFVGGTAVHAADVDGDGDVDVLGARTGAFVGAVDGEIAWWENDGAEGFSKHVLEDGSASRYSVYAADIDADGEVDILDAGGAQISWWENQGDRSFDKHPIASHGGRSVHAADVDGDADMDVLLAAAEILWYEQGPPVTYVYLPLVLRIPPPPSSAPVLDEISNPDGDSRFTVSWSAVSGATGYELQEADNAAFSSPTTTYSGPNTSTSVTVVDAGTYYYRVRAANSLGIGPWSNVASVEVTTTLPDVVPEPGTWYCTTAIATVRFTVSSDSSSVSNGYISISCGSKSISGPAPIEDSGFTLAHSDGFSFISATFDEEDHAEGSYGIWRSGSCWALGTMSCTP